jgi:hypothetical protein
MPSYAEYFQKNTYKPRFYLGDRIRGKWCNVPFTGVVSIDTLIDTDEGPYVIVTLDLPMKIDGKYLTMLKVKHSDLLDVKDSFYESGNKKKNRLNKRVR